MTGADQVTVVKLSCWKTQSAYSSGAALAMAEFQCRLCGSAEKAILFLGVACQVRRRLLLGFTDRSFSPRRLRLGT